MATNNLNHSTDLARFRLYYAGEMSMKEQHAFEKELLEDPFLSEAYEGFIKLSTNNADLVAVRRDLNMRLASRLEENESRRIPVWTYISAAFVLLSIGWLGYYRFEKEEVNGEVANNNQILKTELPIKNSAEPARSTDFQKALQPIDDDPKKEVAGESQPIKKDSLRVLPKDLSFSREELVAIQDQSAVSGKQVISVPASPSPSFLSAKKAVKVSKNNVSYVSVIQGRVTDTQGNGLPGISIYNSPFEVGTTDSNGNFRVTIPGRDSLKLIGLGYKEKWVSAKRADNSPIVLQDNVQALNEVVVKGYGIQSKRSMATTRIEDRKAAPTDGWEKYSDYLKENAAEYGFKGSVKVTFRVISDGSLMDFMATESGERGEAAIKIVKSGPKWSPAVTQNVRVAEVVELTVDFDK
jgi:hypothetical protein